MKPEKSKLKGRLLLIILLVAVLSWVFILSKSKYTMGTLPILGERYLDQKGDTVFHTIDSFSLTDQNGISFTQDSVSGKIHLASFFFTSCPEVCPAVNSNILLVQNKFKDANDVLFVSYTVDPEVDSVEQLAKYAKKYGDPQNWKFITGPKHEIYGLAEFSYLAVHKGASQANWAHTELLTLVDEKGHIRAVFEGRGDQLEINKIIDAIKLLRLERANNLKNKE